MNFWWQKYSRGTWPLTKFQGLVMQLAHSSVISTQSNGWKIASIVLSHCSNAKEHNLGRIVLIASPNLIFITLQKEHTNATHLSKQTSWSHPNKWYRAQLMNYKETIRAKQEPLTCSLLIPNSTKYLTSPHPNLLNKIYYRIIINSYALQVPL